MGEPSGRRMGRGHFSGLDYHRVLLDDVHRMDAYERAIRALVRPGDIVVDLGTGTGILAMLAARRGAERVHAIESAPVGGLARQLIADNGLSDRIVVHSADARELEPVEPADVVIGEFMGRYLVDDYMLSAVDAALRWLKPGGRFCPGRIDLYLAPVGGIGLEEIDLFRTPMYGLDLSGALPYALNCCYARTVASGALLSDPALYARYEPAGRRDRFDRRMRFEMTGEGEIRALAGWFDATLAPGVVLSTRPGVETHWGQYLFPVPPVSVVVGDVLEIALRLDHDDDELVWRWRGCLSRGRGERVEIDLESKQRLGQRGAGDECSRGMIDRDDRQG